MSGIFFRNWSNEIHRGLLELDILNDIRNRGTYAYDIERKFSRTRGPHISRGTIYKILKRFKQQRLLKSTVMKSPDGPNRKYYQLTSLGFEVLAQMNSYWQATRQQTDYVKKGKR